MGFPHSELTLTEDAAHPGQWSLNVRGPNGANQVKIRCGAGTSPQFVREQMFQQLS